MNSTFDALREQIMEIADQELPRRFIDCASSAKAAPSMLTGADLAIQGPLDAMFPAATVILAWVVLGERLTRQRQLGLALALAAVGLVAAG